MKKIINKSLSILIIILMSTICFSCANPENTEKQNRAEQNELTQNEKKSLWADALYTENKTFGSGAKTIELEVKAGDKSVTFTVNTDADNLEEALVEHKLIEGDKGPYGLYVKKVNGITADYDVDQSYWALSQDGTPSSTGASGAEIKGGEHFEFVYTK